METYQVKNIFNNIKRTKFTKDTPLIVSVPGSKSITNRALLLATLACGPSLLKGALFSDDSRSFLNCIKDLGFETTVDEENTNILVKGQAGRIPKASATINVNSAGTAARFLTALLGISHGNYICTSSEQMKRRPMTPLLDSLKTLGCEIDFMEREGFFPFSLKSNGFGQNEITINIDKSSQFLSALLISACLCPEDFTIHITGTHGMAYIDMTVKMIEQFGVKVLRLSDDTFVIKSGQAYSSKEYQIEPDVSAACYFYALSPLLGIPVIVKDVHKNSMQGDLFFINILEQMGCTSFDTDKGILVLPPQNGVFNGVEVDMSTCSDQAITLACIACFASTATTIKGIGHIRLQESDRIKGIATELSKMGIKCEEKEDSIKIFPGSPSPSTVLTYEDHRMAMGFSLIGLRASDIIIDNPTCCSKTFENYFQVLDTVCDLLLS